MPTDTPNTTPKTDRWKDLTYLRDFAEELKCVEILTVARYPISPLEHSDLTECNSNDGPSYVFHDDEYDDCSDCFVEVAVSVDHVTPFAVAYYPGGDDAVVITARSASNEKLTYGCACFGFYC
jgi:hypothetical protein